MIDIIETLNKEKKSVDKLTEEVRGVRPLIFVFGFYLCFNFLYSSKDEQPTTRQCFFLAYAPQILCAQSNAFFIRQKTTTQRITPTLAQLILLATLVGGWCLP